MCTVPISKTSYLGKQGQHSELSKEVLEDLRRHHFKLGHLDSTEYESVNKRDYQEKVANVAHKEDILKKVEILRRHNFSFGSDPPSY